jgi:hypothetical protein
MDPIQSYEIIKLLSTVWKSEEDEAFDNTKLEKMLLMFKEPESYDVSLVIEWLVNKLRENKLPEKLADKFIIMEHGHHYYFARQGVPISDTVRPSLVKLRDLSYQYDIPIDYETLYNIPVISEDIRKEVERVLRLERVIALNPKKEIAWDILWKLLMAWLSSSVLTKHIRRISINTRPEKNEPMIKIIGNYGLESVGKAIKKIDFYLQCCKNSGGECSDKYHKITPLILIKNSLKISNKK